jgi:TonB family protein
VLGFLKPRIVLPHWLAERDASFRALVIRHEREHIAARDQLSLLAALLLVATMPWNLALWWQFRRLRTAIEFDCDRRVLGTGVNPRAYSQALLTVGSQAPRTPFAAVALTEPASVLEQRIRGMLVQARNLSLAACGARLLLAVGTIGLAFAVNAPKAQQAAEVPEGDAPPSSSTQTTDMRFIPALRLVISDQFNAANECLQRRDTDCAFGILDEINEMSDLNVYEAGQLQNFYAFANFEVDNFAGAASAYETILALPRAQLPPGLVASTMRNLATLYLQFDRLQDGLDMYQGYLALPFVTPGVSDHFLLAQLHYQLEQYSEALSAIEQAIAASPEPQRVHYELLLGIQSATGDETGLAATRETLAANWPDTSSDDARVPPESQNAFPGMRFGISDGEYLPIVKVAPTYPPSAAAQGLEGYVIVEYTVTATGSTEDVRVVEGSSSIFDAAAVESAQKYKYMPRVIDGTPVAVPGVRTRIEFVLDSATGA